MTHENKNNEAPGNKASEIKKNVVELNENDLSRVAGGAGERGPDDQIPGGRGPDDQIPGDPGRVNDSAEDITIVDDGKV